MFYNESEKISSLKYLHWVLPLVTSSVTRNTVTTNGFLSIQLFHIHPKLAVLALMHSHIFAVFFIIWFLRC